MIPQLKEILPNHSPDSLKKRPRSITVSILQHNDDVQGWLLVCDFRRSAATTPPIKTPTGRIEQRARSEGLAAQVAQPEKSRTPRVTLDRDSK